MAKPTKPKPEPKKKAPKPVSETEAPARTLDDINASRGPDRVAALRNKFAEALEDPDMREAMARYIQRLLREDGKG